MTTFAAPASATDGLQSYDLEGARAKRRRKKRNVVDVDVDAEGTPPMNDNLKMFIPITKVDAAQRLVYGVATAEIEDRSGEICDYATTKPHYEKWSGDIHKSTDGKSMGNVRAMHGKVAAGKVTAITYDDEAKKIEICTKVVDDAEWNKVEEGVYTGFSQGGAYVKRWKDAAGLQRYTANPSEISLVDLPCLATATFQMIKVDGATENRQFKTVLAEPTNAEIADRATVLAKAAGDENKWPAFVDAARTELTKAKGAGKRGQDGKSGEDGKDGPNGESGGKGGKAGKGGPAGPDGEDGGDGGDGQDGTDAQAGEPGKDGANGEDGEAGKDGEDGADGMHGKDRAKGAKKVAGTPVDGDEWEQVWLSKRDGATFKSKAELRRHHETLDAAEIVKKTASPTNDVLGAINKALGIAPAEEFADLYKLADGETALDPVHVEKRTFTSAERKKAVESGAAMPGGSFPIANKGDLENAVKAYGRAKDPAEAKKHITARAKALGATDLLPADWEASTKKADKAVLPKLLQKGLPTVARLACLIEELKWIESSVHMEARQEGDQSPVVGQTQKNLADLCTTLNAMCAEETAELVDGQNVDDLNNVPNIFNMAAGLPAAHLSALTKFTAAAPTLVKVSALLTKLGARNSASDKVKIQAMHDTSVDLGADCSVDADKSHNHRDLAKVADELGKITAERDEFKKQIGVMQPQLEEILKRVKNIEEQPLPLPLAGTPRVVTKGSEVPDFSDPAQVSKFVEENREVLLLEVIKMSQRQPHGITTRG